MKNYLDMNFNLTHLNQPGQSEPLVTCHFNFCNVQTRAFTPAIMLFAQLGEQLMPLEWIPN